MSFILPKSPWLTFMPTLAIDQRDRFGLPMYSPTLLCNPIERQAIEEQCAALARDAVESLERLVGRAAMRKLFRKAMAQPKAGKSPNTERNHKLLAKYDSEFAKKPGSIKEIAERLAKTSLRDPSDSEKESMARQLRRLVAKRTKLEQDRQKFQKFFQSLPHPLLQAAADIKGE
jgi:hypothetical protein